MACAGDVPTMEALAATALLREHLPDLRLRFVNVVDLFRLVPQTEHPHGLSDHDFDSLFTTDKPIIFTFHGYPWLIHRLTYRRTNHKNLHVSGYKEDGTISTAFDMTVMNDLDRFHWHRTWSIAFRSSGAAPRTPSKPCATSSSSTSSTSASMATTCPRSANGSGGTTKTS